MFGNDGRIAWIDVFVGAQQISRLGNHTLEGAVELVAGWRGWTEPDEFGDRGYARDATVRLEFADRCVVLWPDGSVSGMLPGWRLDASGMPERMRG